MTKLVCMETDRRDKENVKEKIETINLEVEDDNSPPQYYTIRWWNNYQSSHIFHLFDWCHTKGVFVPSYAEFDRITFRLS